jgi:hypothetical protein
MLYEAAERIRSVRLRRSVRPLGGNLYEVCPHWWSWWLPDDPSIVWNFWDDNGNAFTATSTYGTDPVFLTTTASLQNFIIIPAFPVNIVHISELDTAVKEAYIPTLFLVADASTKVSPLQFPYMNVFAMLVIPQNAKWSAELTHQTHEGMLSAVSDIMKEAMIEVTDATWVSQYGTNRGVLRTGEAGLPIESNVLSMNLGFYLYR